MKNRFEHAVRKTASTGRRPAAVLVAVLATAALALTACSSSGSTATNTGNGGSTSSGTSSSSSSPANAKLTAEIAKATGQVSVDVNLKPLTKLPAVKGRTVLIVPISAVPFSGVISDVESALKVVGASAHVCDGQAQAATIASCLAQAGSINAVAVVTLAIPYELAPTAFNGLARQKIPVLAAFQDPQVRQSSPSLTYEPSSPTLTQALDLSADYEIVHSDFKGDILVLIITDSAEQIQQGKDVVAYIKKTCPGCKVQSANVATANIDQASTTVSAAVLRDPDINWILPQNQDSFGSSVYSGLQSASDTGKVSVGGPGGGLGGMQLVSQKHATFFTPVSNDIAAWNAVDGMLRLLGGEAVPTAYPTAVRLFDSTNIGSVQLTASGANSFGWFGTPTFESAYKKLWGVG